MAELTVALTVLMMADWWEVKTVRRLAYLLAACTSGIQKEPLHQPEALVWRQSQLYIDSRE